MGYDAYVRCNCFEKGKVKPFRYLKYVKACPEWLELELPEEIKNQKKLSDEIENDFYDWCNTACEHEYMEYYSERLCNISGMAWLKSCLDWLNVNNEFSTLRNQLPESNDDFMPIEYNNSFIKEFETFLKNKITLYRLISAKKDSYPYYFYYGIKENEDYLLCEKNGEKLYSHNGVFRIEKDNKIVFQSSKFTVDRIINRRFIFTDKNKKAETTVFFDLRLFEKGNRHTLSYEKETFDMRVEFQHLYDIFINLANASKITGNPICWS